MSSKDAQAMFRAAKAQRAGAVKLVLSNCFCHDPQADHRPISQRSKSARSRQPRPRRLHNRRPRHPSLQQVPAQHSVPLQTTAAPCSQVRGVVSLRGIPTVTPSGLVGGLLTGYGSSDDDDQAPPVAASVSAPVPKGAPADLPDGARENTTTPLNTHACTSCCCNWSRIPADFFQEPPAAVGTAQATPPATAEEFDRFMSEVHKDLKQQEEEAEEERQQVCVSV